MLHRRRVVNVGNGQRSTGPEAIRADHEDLFAMDSEIVVDKLGYVVEGNRLADEWTMSGVHSGDVRGLPATGRPFRISGCGVGEVRDGRPARVTLHRNMAEFLAQVAVLPPPGE